MTLAAQSTKDSKYIHDTAKLMQNYRDVLWNVEVSNKISKQNFAQNMALPTELNHRFRYFQSAS